MGGGSFNTNSYFQGILDRKPVTDPHLMFMGIGDAACDQRRLGA